MTARAVLLVGHADPQSFNHQLAERYVRGFERGGGQIERFDLATLDFDPVLRSGFRAQQELEPDLLRVRSAIETHDHLVWIFPTYWASPPAVVRGFFDRLFLPGWAFRFEEGNPFPIGLLKGKSARVIVTMDSANYWYTLWYGRSMHFSFGRGSLRFCGVKPVEFTPIYDVLHLSEKARASWLIRVESLGFREATKLSVEPKVRRLRGALG